MKYDSLRKGSYKTFRVNKLDGGVNYSLPPLNINDNQLSDCKNVWFNGGTLQTRPGLSCEISKAIESSVSDGIGMNQYKLHNTGVCIEGEYMRIATSEFCYDDYVYYCNVFLVGENGNYTPIGKLSFFRTTSEIFYMPINILFYTGKAQTGGGIFAMVTVQNQYYEDERYYNIFEISSDFTEWNKLYNFYIPTLYINGRGNKYALAKANNEVNLPAPKILESPNMLNGRFHSYFTSDGYSSSFRLPFSNLSSESIVCRIYYTLVDYVEWQVGANNITNKQKFFGSEVTMEVDREKGTVYFTSDGKDYSIPIMDMYNENNIKITATKEIEHGREKIIHSTCACKYKSRIIVSGGKNGNEVYVADYESPLYFPQNSSVEIGSDDSEVVDLSIKDDKIVVLKQDGIYSLSLKMGDKINEISLLADNDKCFTSNDNFTCNIITNQIGCYNKDFTAILNDNIIFLGQDRRVYAISSLDAQNVICISDELGEEFEYFKYADFAFGGNNRYIIFRNNKAFVAEITPSKKIIWYYWEFSQKFKIRGGFLFKNTFWFLCSSKDTEISYMAVLNADEDEFIEYNSVGDISKSKLPIESNITTKHFNFSCLSKCKNIESIYLSLASKQHICISVNGTEIADVNLRVANREYRKHDYKSVKLTPYLNNNSVYITLSSKSGMSIGDLEIIYRKTG